MMLDWKLIQGHGLRDGESALFWVASGMREFYLPGVYFESLGHFPTISLHQEHCCEYRDGGGGDYKNAEGDTITHYARITGPDTPNPLREVWEKYKHLNDILDVEPSPYNWVTPILINCWRAIKAALGISQPVTEEETNYE